MSGAGFSGEKPKKDYQRLGPNVSVEVEELERDGWAEKLLADIGKTVGKGAGREYLGSAAMHLYAVPKVNLLGEVELAFITQVQLGEVSEIVAQQAVGEFTKAVMRAYGHRRKSIDPNYTVGE